MLIDVATLFVYGLISLTTKYIFCLSLWWGLRSEKKPDPFFWYVASLCLSIGYSADIMGLARWAKHFQLDWYEPLLASPIWPTRLLPILVCVSYIAVRATQRYFWGKR